MGNSGIRSKSAAQLWRLAQGLCTEPMVAAAYRGLLGREPDSSGAHTYARILVEQRDLASLIAGLADSDEFRQRQLMARAPETAHALVRGLLGDDSGSAIAEELATILAERGDLGMAVSHLSHSDALWGRIFAERAQELVHAIGRGIGDGLADGPQLEECAAFLHTGPIGLVDALLCAANSQQHWEWALGRHADELVALAFSSLLGRAAEPEAVGTYNHRIRSTDAFGGVLADIAYSDEAWRRQLEHHAADLIAMIFAGVLERAPNESETERWRAGCFSMPGLTGLLRFLLEGEEFQARQFSGAQPEHGLSMQLVDALYRGLLDRPADTEGQQSFAAFIKCAGDLASVATIMRDSPEFEHVYNKVHGESPAPAGSWSPVVARIEALYLRHLKRPVSARELGQHITDESPVWKVEEQLLANAPARRGPLRVLLFGAYGNGNMGDAYQALAVRAHLAAHFSHRSIEVSACSLLCSSDYAYPPEFTLRPESILDVELVNSYDYLVIGGGGLLAHPHDPLAEQTWCERIHTPIILLAVGATAAEVARHHPLLGQALHVIGRDASSVAALATVRPDVLLAPDPILCLGGIEHLLSPHSADQVPASGPDVLWVLKYPANAGDRALLARIRAYMAETGESRHLVVGIEPALDTVLADQFDGVPLVLTESLDELANLIHQAGRVFSMRYHGAIFALLMDRQVLGASQSKLRDLAARLDAPAAYLESAARIGPDMWRCAMAATPEQLSSMNAEFGGVLATLRLTS